MNKPGSSVSSLPPPPKDVRRTLADDSLPILSVQIRPFDDMVLGVHPVDAAAGVVDG